MAPVGFMFLPNEQEVFYYLRKKVNGEKFSTTDADDDFIDCNIYGGDNREPWNLFDKSSSETLYVFTPLNKKGKTRIDRVAGSGFWNFRSTKDEVKSKDDPTKVLGFKKYFNFKIKNHPGNTDNGNWVMHEFSLLDDDSYVLCKIRNKDATADDALFADIQETSSCGEYSKKRSLDVGQEDQPRKKMRIGSSSAMTVVQEPVVAYDQLFEEEPEQEPVVAYQLFEEEPVPVLEVGPESLTYNLDDGVGTNELAPGSTSHEVIGLYQPSSLISDQEFDFSVEPNDNEIIDLDYLSYLLNQEPPMEENSERSDVNDADFWSSLLNEEPSMEDNQSTWHGTNIQVTMPTHVL